MARKKPVSGANKNKLLADQAVALAEYAAKGLIAAEQLRFKKKAVKGFPLDEAERAIAAELPGITATLRIKLARKKATFTIADTASIVMALADSLLEGEPLKRLVLLFAAKKLIDCLEHNIVMPDLQAKASKAKPTDTVYQFKITLKESQPPIWRRIQVKNCTLDKLHEHIQTAMGWTNCHLNQFKIGEQYYGDPMLMRENFDEMGYEDSTTTNLSDIIPANVKKMKFFYEYDFGDSWYHEVLFEGFRKEESGKNYPLCVAGRRACPPEDCGGIWGYPNFIQAIENPNHERHEELLEWMGGSFDPEAFDVDQATEAMKKGLGKWGTTM